MPRTDLIRAWKDADFRAALTEGERALLPANPAGAIDLSSAELEGIDGGRPRGVPKTMVCTFLPCILKP